VPFADRSYYRWAVAVHVLKLIRAVIAGAMWLKALAYNVGALRRRPPELVSPCRQFIKVTKAGHLFNRSSVLSQLGGALDLKTALKFIRQPLAQNPLLAVGEVSQLHSTLHLL